MNVVGHQRIGMEATAGFAGMLGQPLQIEAGIFVSKETGFAVIAALDQVKRDARQGETGTAWYGRLLGRIKELI